MRKIIVILTFIVIFVSLLFIIDFDRGKNFNEIYNNYVIIDHECTDNSCWLMLETPDGYDIWVRTDSSFYGYKDSDTIKINDEKGNIKCLKP